MSGEDSSFRDVVRRACEGSEDAIRELYETYGPHIQRAVRRSLNQKIQSKFDSFDFVQDAWISFFAEPDLIRQFKDKDPKELLRYLARMAKNKLLQESRKRLGTQKHDVRRECTLDPHKTPESSYVRKSKTPSQFVMAREQLAHLFDGKSERDRQVLEMRMNGSTFIEISQELGIDERTARKVIKKLDGVEAGA